MPLHPSSLPYPGSEELAHSQCATEVLRAAMERSGGILAFVDFMRLALYAPETGYYSSGLHKFGESGDFVTAPEISSLFGRCLARQCAEVKALRDGTILEFGAGSGKLAADLLAELEYLDSLPQRYLIIEVSAALRHQQQTILQQRVPHLTQRVEWLDSLPQKKIRGVILANEVLDAMPVQRFQLDQQGNLSELSVTWRDGEFAWQSTEPQKTDLPEVLEKIQQDNALPRPYASEYNPHIPAWLQAVSDSLAEGLVLLIDYGFPRHEYYHPQRSQGTLMCHYRHHSHPDPLLYPGLQDITAHVDFTAVAEAANEAGLHVTGYTSQADFLLGCGLDELLAQSNPEDIQKHTILVRQAQKLIMPGEMGELFKVIALSRGLSGTLRGFTRDRRGRL